MDEENRKRRHAEDLAHAKEITDAFNAGRPAGEIRALLAAELERRTTLEEIDEEAARKRRGGKMDQPMNECICLHPRSQHTAEGPCRNGACGCLGFRTPIQFITETEATIEACRRAVALKIKRERDYPDE